MTKEMAIKILRGGVLGTDELTHEAVFMAIKALKEQARADAVPVVRRKDCVYCKRFNDVWYFPKRVEVVRCKDCKYYKGLAECYVIGDCMGTYGYCAWGERREDGAERK